MIKIIGGEFKKSKIIVANNIRPTSSIKREAIFSIIESYALKNKIALYKNRALMDIFAGSGAVGLEGISRGMEQAYFYENNLEVIKILKKNCKNICKKKKYKIIEKNIMTYSPEKISMLVSLIFIDPPYYKYDISRLLIILLNKKIINNETIIIIEKHKNDILKINKEFEIFNIKFYGISSLYFVRLII